MPQIWPMNWIMLFIFYLVVLLTFLILSYFLVSISPNTNLSQKNLNLKSLNWLW